MKQPIARPDAPAFGLWGAYPVGTTEFTLTTERGPMPATAWYPAQNPTDALEETTYTCQNWAVAVKGRALRDATPDATRGPYPLIINSQGSDASRHLGAYLSEHLASWGMVVLAADYEDNPKTYGQPYHRSLISRPKDLSALLDMAERGEILPNLCDMARVGAVGVSYGGYTVLAAAGAHLNTDALRQFYDQYGTMGEPDNELDALDELAALAGVDHPPSGPWPTHTDTRIKTLVTMAPSARFFDPAELATLPQSLLMIGGTADATIHPEGEIRLPYQHISGDKALLMFENAGHFIYCPVGDDVPALVKAGFFWLVSDPVWDMQRAHDILLHYTTAFLLHDLMGDAAAKAALHPDAAKLVGIHYETTIAQRDEAVG